MADALRGGIVINEILPDPNSAVGSSGPRYDTDGSGTVTPTDEFIEIVNTTGAAINIGGLQLWDQAVGNWFTFPTGTILAAGGHAMVMVGVSGGPGPTLGPNDQAFYAGRGSAVLNNGPENAILRDPVTNTFVQIAYGGASIVTPGVTGAFSTFPAGATRVGSGENFGSFTPGQSIQRAPDGSNVFNNSGTPTAGTSNVCFAKGTRIATPAGPIPVETLGIGDLILLEDGTTAPVIWIGQKHFSADDLQGQPLLWPVHLAVDALGANIPSAPLRLSRQHRLCVTGSIALRMTGSDKVLLAAHCLLGLPGITTKFPDDGIDYFHVLLPDHAIVIAEGTPAESLYLGPEAQRALSETAIDELALIFPDKPWLDGAPTPVYPLLSPRRALRLVARHRQNKLPLIAPPQTAPPRDGRAVPKRG